MNLINYRHRSAVKTSLFTLVVGGCVHAQPASTAQTVPTAGLFNAVLPKYGAKASVETGPGVVKDKTTNPGAYLDGNHHSRYVITGAPYTITVELPVKVMVERIALSQSDYGTEAAPKDIEITLDDGQKLSRTLDNSRPSRRGRNVITAWQDVPVGKEIQSFKVTILSNHEGQVKWGGLGDIAVWTRENLDERFKVADYDPNSPTFVHTPDTVNGKAPSVKLPPVAKAGEHPRLLFTASELQDFKQQLEATERGKTTYEKFIQVANTGLKPPVFPSVEDTVANKAGKAHDTLSYRAGSMGMAYALTGDKKYAEAVREILVGYAQRYADYPRHQGFNRNDQSKIHVQRLSEAMWLIPQLEGYDYIANSRVLSSEDKKLIGDKLFRAAIEEIRRRDPATEVAARDQKNPNWRTEKPQKTKSAVGNWLNFFNTATIMVGSLLGDQNMIDLATADFKELLINGIGEDGMWGEGAIGYQFFAMNAMVPGFESAARLGIDLYGFDNSRFKRLFDSPLAYAYPDGTMPGINDSGRGRLGSWQTMVYDYGYLRYGEPRYASVVNATQRQLHFTEGIYLPTQIYRTVEEPQSTVLGSRYFKDLGYAILENPRAYALMDYGPHGGVHGHYDKLNMLLFASPPTGSGDEMGGEPKFRFYTDSLHPQWVVHTVAHNTMTVDQKSQLAGDGRLTVFESTPEIKVMRGESAEVYPGVLLDRTMVIAGDAVIDLYSGSSSMPHSWDRTFRYSGKLDQMPADTPNLKPLGKIDGYEHIQVAKQQPATADWRGTWDNKAGKFDVLLAGAPGQEAIVALGPDQEEMMIARQNGTESSFAAVYGLQSWNNGIQSAKWLARGSRQQKTPSAFEVTHKDGTITRLFVAHVPGTWQSNGWQSDARVLTIRIKGGQMTALLGGGTFAQQGKLEVREATAGNYLVTQKGNALEVTSKWTPG